MLKHVFLLPSLLLFTASAFGEIVQITEVPIRWKLENYIGDNVVAWYTGSSCANGQINFPSNATADDKNRFWSIVMTGKVSGKKVFVRYNTTDCKIQSFGLSQE